MSQRDCFSDPPSVPGKYAICIEGVLTFVAIYWNWDGQKWIIDDDWHKNRKAWWWYDDK